MIGLPRAIWASRDAALRTNSEGGVAELDLIVFDGSRGPRAKSASTEATGSGSKVVGEGLDCMDFEGFGALQKTDWKSSAAGSIIFDKKWAMMIIRPFEDCVSFLDV